MSSSFSRNMRCLTGSLYLCAHVGRNRLLCLAHDGCASLVAIGNAAGSLARRQPTIGSLLWSWATRGYHQQCSEAACKTLLAEMWLCVCNPFTFHV